MRCIGVLDTLSRIDQKKRREDNFYNHYIVVAILATFSVSWLAQLQIRPFPPFITTRRYAKYGAGSEAGPDITTLGPPDARRQAIDAMFHILLTSAPRAKGVLSVTGQKNKDVSSGQKSSYRPRSLQLLHKTGRMSPMLGSIRSLIHIRHCSI